MDFETYIEHYAEDVYSELGWNDVDEQFIIDETLEAYGVATEVLATELVKAHAILRFKIWERALNAVSLDYNFSSDGASFNRQQMYEMIKRNYDAAYAEASPYLPGYSIEIGNLDYNNTDPYSQKPYYQRYI
jgi:hypothetical protein